MLGTVELGCQVDALLHVQSQPNGLLCCWTPRYGQINTLNEQNMNKIE